MTFCSIVPVLPISGLTGKKNRMPKGRGVEKSAVSDKGSGGYGPKFSKCKLAMAHCMVTFLSFGICENMVPGGGLKN